MIVVNIVAVGIVNNLITSNKLWTIYFSFCGILMHHLLLFYEMEGSYKSAPKD